MLLLTGVSDVLPEESVDVVATRVKLSNMGLFRDGEVQGIQFFSDKLVWP